MVVRPGIDLRGDGDIVEADHGHVFRHALVQLAQRAQDADGQGVGDGKDGRRRVGLRHHAQGGGRARFIVEALHRVHPLGLYGQAGRSQGVQIALLALPRVQIALIGIDQADARVAARQ